MLLLVFISLYFFFFFNDTATTEIYTLSLHDALPILSLVFSCWFQYPAHVESPLIQRLPISPAATGARLSSTACCSGDRKSTRLNSSHANISYAVFCLKKKKINEKINDTYHYHILYMS